MTVTTSATITTKIQASAIAFIFKQVVMLSEFPTSPIQQVLYIVGTTAKYWNGTAWISLSGGGGTQIQSDWNQTNISSVDYIKNKPTIPAAQIQSDWNQSTNTALDYIKNKPSFKTINSESVIGTGNIEISGGLDKTFQTLVESATITFDAATSVNGSVTLTASRILGNITNAVVGEVHCVKVIQGGSGSYALTYGNQYKFSGGVLPILSATVNAVDLLFFLAVSTTEFYFVNANFDLKTP